MCTNICSRTIIQSAIFKKNFSLNREEVYISVKERTKEKESIRGTIKISRNEYKYDGLKDVKNENRW